MLKRHGREKKGCLLKLITSRESCIWSLIWVELAGLYEIVQTVWMHRIHIADTVDWIHQVWHSFPTESTSATLLWTISKNVLKNAQC